MCGGLAGGKDSPEAFPGPSDTAVLTHRPPGPGVCPHRTLLLRPNLWESLQQMRWPRMATGTSLVPSVICGEGEEGRCFVAGSRKCSPLGIRRPWGGDPRVRQHGKESRLCHCGNALGQSCHPSSSFSLPVTLGGEHHATLVGDAQETPEVLRGLPRVKELGLNPGPTQTGDLNHASRWQG